MLKHCRNYNVTIQRKIPFHTIPSMNIMFFIYIFYLIIYDFIYCFIHYFSLVVLSDFSIHPPTLFLFLYMLYYTNYFAQGHIELVPLYACMKKRSLVNLTKVVVFSILLSLGVYTLVGVLGLLSFGDKVATDMITNYDATDPVVIVAMVAVTIKAIITYPIILFCTR